MMIVDPEDQQKGQILELDLEKEMLTSRLMTSSNQFQTLLETAKLLKKGTSLFSLPKVSLEAEKVFDIKNADMDKIASKVPELEAIITLKQTEALKKQHEKIKQISENKLEKKNEGEMSIADMRKEKRAFEEGNRKLEVEAKKEEMKLEQVKKEVQKQLEVNVEMIELERKMEILERQIKEAEKENRALKQMRSG
jgi:hypothetical protein